MYHLLLLFLPLLVLLAFLRHGRPLHPYAEGLTYYPLLGILPQFLANRDRLLDWFTGLLIRSPTNTIFIMRPGVRGIITANPTNVEHILHKNFDNYPKGKRFTSNLHDFLGEGIFNSDGAQWRVQRKSASFEFNTKSLRTFVVDSVQDEIVTRLFPFLEKSAKEHRTIDLHDVLERFAFDNICKLAFDRDPACLGGMADHDEGTNGFASAFKEASYLSLQRFRYPIPRLWKIKKLFNVGTEKSLRKSVTTVQEFAENIIRSRRKEHANSSSRADLLSRFMLDHSSEEYLRDIVISFLLAGRDTTSTTLAWFFWILSTRRDVETRILEELRSVRKHRRSSQHGMLGFDDLRELHYLHAAISETLRLYPAVPMNSIQSLGNDTLPDGTQVKEGWFLSYSSYAMGRIKAIWGEDCLEYRPERWLNENGKFRPESPFKFTAFHAGPRMCLGKEMAYIQMKLVAASMLERFEVDVREKDRQPEYFLSLTLRMKHGLPVTVKERSASDPLRFL